jgi:hypothetical protein
MIGRERWLTAPDFATAPDNSPLKHKLPARRGRRDLYFACGVALALDGLGEEGALGSKSGNSSNRSKKRLGVDSTFNCQSPRQVVDEIAKREIAGDNVWRILPWKITCHYCFSRCRANVASSRIGRQS